MSTVAVPVSESSQVAAARRAAGQVAARLGFGECDAGRVALVATEAATNLLKHASRGELLCSAVENGGGTAVELLALDRGPGFADLPACLRDGYSTSGSPGTGLGAMQRLSATFDVYSRPAQGSAVLCRVQGGGAARRESPGALRYGAVSVPREGEEVCGDSWSVYAERDRASVMVADGLGHGPGAAQAAQRAVEAVLRDPLRAPGRILEDIHLALRSTRGAAVGVARLEPAAAKLEFAGVGNLLAILWSPAGRRALISHPGTVGHEMRKVQEFQYPLPPAAMLVICSDGISSHWDLSAYPDIAAHNASLIAGLIYRDFSRRRDDATVVVVRPGL